MLADYTIPREEVPLGRGKSFTVRGLSLPDITYLVQNHLGDLTKAVDIYLAKKAGRLAKSTLAEFAMVIARDLPNLAGQVIAIASDEEDQLPKVLKLPILAQINALLLICKLTTEEAGGLKNLLAFAAPILHGLVAGAESEPGTLKRKLLDSIGDYARMSASSPAQD